VLKNSFKALDGGGQVYQMFWLKTYVLIIWQSYTLLAYIEHSGFGGLVVSMPASGVQDRGFAPGRSRQIFSGEKMLSMPSFGREVKPFAPCRRFAACQRTL
jgi:hypothetical protein